MIITCGQCQARFKVAPEQIKVTGSKVRCSHCLYVFTVYRPGGPEIEGDAPQAPEENSGLFRDEEAESREARRERRRRLYAGPDGEGGEEDDPSDDEGWAEAGLDEASGRPPLRRRPAEPSAGPGPSLADSPELEQPQTEQPQTEQSQVDPSPAEAPEIEDSWADEPAEAGDDLGLDADPTLTSQAAPLRQVGDDLPPPLASSYSSEVRAAITKVKGRRNGLFLALAIFCAALAIGLYYLSSRPEPLALSEGDGQPPAQSPQAQTLPPQTPPVQTAGVGIDPRGVEHITFTPKDNLKHFYRRNEKEGELLIITGRVRNSYPTPRSFIRLRGLLLDQNGNTLAERFICAGNLISEEDLVTLPRDEIMARLNIKGGQNNQNMNIAPGREVPFMVVFDKVPPHKDEYRIIPVGSDPAD